MVKSRKRSIDEVDSYQSDGGFVSNDDGNASSAPKSKKSKKTGTPTGENKDDDGNPFWELSSGRSQRRIGVQEFNKATLIAIREYYEKDGKTLPAKKGISLTIDQYKALLKAVPEINATLKERGIAIGESDLKAEDESDANTKPVKRVKAKTEKKKNIDATSDEEEEDE